MTASSPAHRSESMASTASISSSTSSSTTPTALPTEEALQLLLSPDGYYKYLSIPKPPTDVMGPKYQAAMAAGGAPPTSNSAETEIDLDQVKKNYRRLSLKHHPDRKTGDAETFRMLNRAKIVLSSPKLRREYDLVGLDLEDDAEDHDHHDDNDHSSTNNNNATDNNDANNGSSSNDDGEAHHEDKDGNKNKTETVMGHLASATLAAVFQVVVRTALMGLVSVVISRYTILSFLAMGMLAFITYRMYSAFKQQRPEFKIKLSTLSTIKDIFSPLIIAFGIFCMYRGRRFVDYTGASASSSIGGGQADNAIVGDGTTNTDSSTTIEETMATQYLEWTWTFLLGETTVMTSFISNSVESKPTPLIVMFTIISSLLSLWLRGRFWRYATILGFEGVIALFVVLAFPIMEMILESIVEEKMRKVGEKIRAHDVRMKELLKRKREEQAAK